MKKSGKKSNSQGVVQNAPLVTALATPTKRQPSRASLQAIVTPEHSDNSAPVTFDSDEPPQSPSQNRLDKITPPRKHGSDATSPISSIKKEFGSKAAASANEHTTPTRKTNSRLHFEEKSSVAVVSPAPANRSTVSVSKNVEAVYKIIRKATGALGGNGHTGKFAATRICGWHPVISLCRRDLRRINHDFDAKSAEFSRLGVRTRRKL